MKKETKSFAEYKAPRCKCVKVHVEGALLQDSYGANGMAGANGIYHDPDEEDF